MAAFNGTKGTEHLSCLMHYALFLSLNMKWPAAAGAVHPAGRWITLRGPAWRDGGFATGVAPRGAAQLDVGGG
jgi:hypothetical protein